MDKIGKFLEIMRRLGAESPDFFKWLQPRAWILSGLSLVALFLSIAGIYEAPEWVDQLLTGLAALFAGTGATAALTVKDKAKANVPGDEPGGEGPGPGGEPPKPPRG